MVMVRQNYEFASGLLMCVVFAIGSVIGITTTSVASEYTWRIFFSDKGPNEFAPGTSLYQETLDLYSPAALTRRLYSIGEPVRVRDAPVFGGYLDTIRRYGNIISVSRWRNCVIAKFDSGAAMQIGSLPFVLNIHRTVESFYVHSCVNSITPQDLAAQLPDCSPADHGYASRHLNALNIPAMHHLGVYGQGVTVGLLDVGFRLRNHFFFPKYPIAEEFNFVTREFSVQGTDSVATYRHGTQVAGILSGWRHGTYVGAAPAVSIIAAATESMDFEDRVEEDWLVEGIEWLESRGVNIISASIGYRFFDHGAFISPEQMDGATTYAARAINEVVELGVIAVTAAGNAGPAPGTLLTPSDADSAVCVGAVHDSIMPADLTSRGDGNSNTPKPDLAAIAMAIAVVGDSTGSLASASGTSLAAPQIAGVAALLRSLTPDSLPSYEIRRAMHETASHASEPVAGMGYGLPNVVKAANRLGPVFGPPAGFINQDTLSVRIPLFAENVELITVVVNDSPWPNVEYSSPYVFIRIPITDVPAPHIRLRMTVSSNEGVIRSFPFQGPLEFDIGEFIPCGSADMVTTSLFKEKTDQIPTPRRHAIPVSQSTLTLKGLQAPVHAIYAVDVTGRQTDVPFSSSGDFVVINIAGLNVGLYVLVINATTARKSVIILRY